MKKILVRSGMSPLNTFSADEIIRKNSIGNNVGNLMFAYSIFRNMTTENTELVSDYYRCDIADAEMINETYNAYVLPMANGFRKSFIPALKKYTALIEKLKIPVYVIGIGMQFPYEPNIKAGYPFDEDVKNFVKAVLKKSNTIGVRGQITADYLTYLGFKEGEDHQVIGCPSMYTFGEHLKIKPLRLTKTSKICTNLTPAAPQHVLKFLNELPQKFNNLDFIPQDIDEMTLTYAGVPSLGGGILNTKLENYPNSLCCQVYREGKVKYFLNAPTWINFMKDVDLSIGTRLHGNIAPTLAGTPTITIPIDARMRELTEYHGLPSVSPDEINERTRLEDLVGKVDFQLVETKHKKNYKYFIKFLETNDIEHIYQDSMYGVLNPLESKLASISLEQPIIPITSCFAEEMKTRLEKSYEVMSVKMKKKSIIDNRTLKNKDAKISTLTKRVKQLKSISADRTKKEELTREIEILKKENEMLSEAVAFFASRKKEKMKCKIL